jgi:hypothetical protein
MPYQFIAHRPMTNATVSEPSRAVRDLDRVGVTNDPALLHGSGRDEATE